MTIPVSACLIVRDDESTLEACLASIRPHVAEIVVVDTGSVDSTPDIARRYADKFEVYTGCNDPDGRIASFSDARNRSFALASHDWVMWADADDVIRGAENIQKIVASADVSPASVMLRYEYSHGADGSPNLVHYRERIVHPRRMFSWAGDVHEVMTCSSNPVKSRDESVVYVHRRQQSSKLREPGRNLRILTASRERDGDSDPRLLYYLAQEQGSSGLIDESLDTIERYMKVSRWADERFMACRMAVGHMINRADYHGAAEWALRAVGIRPEWPEGHYDLARAYYFLARAGVEPGRNWANCVRSARQCIGSEPADTVLFVNPRERDFEVHRYLNFALSRMGLLDEALASARSGLLMSPDDPQLLFNEKYHRTQIARRDALAAVESLAALGGVAPAVSGLMSALLADKPGAAPASAPAGGPASGYALPIRQATMGAPVLMPEGALLSAFQSVWKNLMIHDELLLARKFVGCAPWQIRGAPEVREMSAVMSSVMSHHDDPELFRAHYEHTADSIGELWPMPAPVPEHHSLWPRWNYLTETLSEMESRLGRKLRVLDVGCMYGWLTNRVGQMGHEAHGIDTCGSAIRLASAKAEEFATGARHLVHDAASGDWPDGYPGSFDVVVLFEVYEHVHDPVGFLKRLRELLTPDGCVVISTPRGSWGLGVDFPGHHAWDASTFREHIRAVIPEDAASDFAEAGLHGFSYRVDEAADRAIPGQASLLCRGFRSPRVEHVRSPLTVSVYTGAGMERWNPETAARSGIGGSETAVIEMSRLLARRGHRVTVYGDCSGIEGSFDGVEYADHSRYPSSGRADLLITSRRPSAVDLPDLYRAAVCWVHDVHCGGELTYERAVRIRRFLTLSQWHRTFFMRTYGFLHGDQVAVTRNGIDLARFRKAIRRNPHRAVYGSSPDRGLELAVRAWPMVRSRVPDAELHAFYGFHNWELSASQSGDRAALDRIARLKDALASTDGVTFHGRVDQVRLSEEYLASGVWAYPTWFSETSCISAMEAHAAGLRMVTSPVAALNETVGPRGTMVRGDWASDQYVGSFVDGVVAAMTTQRDNDRIAVEAYARDHFSWESVAAEWDRDLTKVVDESVRSPVVPYARVSL